MFSIPYLGSNQILYETVFEFESSRHTLGEGRIVGHQQHGGSVPLVHFEEQIVNAGYEFCSISAATGAGVRKMLYRVQEMLAQAPESKPSSQEPDVLRPEPDEAVFTVDRLNNGWRVQGRRIERVAAMTYWEFEATTRRFQQILETMGISEALREAGIVNGDIVYIGDQELEWTE